MEIFLIWLVLAIGVGFLASSRGRSGFGFFLVAALLSPLIGLIIVLVTENKTKAAEQAERDRQEHERRLEEVKAITAAPAAAAAMTARAATSVADELKKLAELRDAGVLTAEEFQAQKALMLGSAPAAGASPTAIDTPQQFGSCSNCKTAVLRTATECPKCRVLFGPDSSYRVITE